MKVNSFIILILLISVNVYAADISNVDMSAAKKALNNANTRNTNRYDTSNIKSSLDSWMSKSDSNLKSVMGEKDKKLQTFSGEDVNIDMKCNVSQKKVALLNIGNGTSVNINLSLSEPSQENIVINNVTGVCDTKFTVCDENSNKKICESIFAYTNYGNEGKNTGLDKDSSALSVATSHVCYRVNKCMSWSFKAGENNRFEISPAAGGNCQYFKSSGITLGEKEALVTQVKSVLGEILSDGLSNASSDNTNTKTEFYALSYNDCSGGEYGNYGSGSTDINDLLNYYNNPKTDEAGKKQITDEQRKDNNSMLSKLENAPSKDNFTLSQDIIDTVNKGMDRVDSITPNVTIEQVCYTPVCTVDIYANVAKVGTDGSDIGKDHTSYKRVFRDCIASSFKDKGNGVKETVYKCPINNSTETAVAQANGDICSCNNAHQMSANLQKVLIATSMADAIKNSACGKNDEDDNKTLSSLTERRKECSGKTGQAYSDCMNKEMVIK